VRYANGNGIAAINETTRKAWLPESLETTCTPDGPTGETSSLRGVLAKAFVTGDGAKGTG